MPLAAEDPSWLFQLLKDAGPVVVAIFLVFLMLYAGYRYIGRPVLESWQLITESRATAAASYAEAARANADSANSNAESARVLRSLVVRAGGLIKTMDKQIDRLESIHRGEES